MATDSPVWHRINNMEIPTALADEPVLNCFLGKVFHYWIGRNAYWGRWSSTYPGDSSFSLDGDELQRRIEAHRVKGSTFTLTELPALVLSGRKLCLVLFQAWGWSPYKDVPFSAISGDSLLEIARAVANHA